MSYGERITAVRPPRSSDSKSGAVLTSLAVRASPSSRSCGSPKRDRGHVEAVELGGEELVGGGNADELPVGINGLHFGPERVGEFLAGADAVGKQKAATVEIRLDRLPLRLAPGERPSAVHEDDREIEQLRVGRGHRRAVRGINLHFELLLEHPEQVGKGIGRVVRSAAMIELGNDERAAAGEVVLSSAA